MSQAARNLMELIHGLYKMGGPFETYVERKLICTPIKANYDTISAWVFSVNGSPPKGTLYVVMDSGHDVSQVVFLSGVTSKRVSANRKLQIVAEFNHHHLRGKELPFVITATDD